MITKVFLPIFFLICLLLTLSIEALAGTRVAQFEKKSATVVPGRRLTIPVAPGGQFEKKPTPVVPPGGYHTEQLHVEPKPPQYQPTPQQMKMEPQPPPYQAPVPEGQFVPQASQYQAPAPPTGRIPAQDQKAAPPKYQSPDEWFPQGTK